MKDPTYKECVASYFDFYKNRNKGISPKFDGGDGKILKMLIKHLAEIGQGNSKDNLNVIFSNWEKLEKADNFYKHNYDIKMVYACINRIIPILTSKNETNRTAEGYQKAYSELKGSGLL